MDLIFIRHPNSVSRDEFAGTGKDDRLRPISDAGREEMIEIAREIHQLVAQIESYVQVLSYVRSKPVLL